MGQALTMQQPVSNIKCVGGRQSKGEVRVAMQSRDQWVERCVRCCNQTRIRVSPKVRNVVSIKEK